MNREAFIVKKLESKTKKAIYDYNLIEDGDKILVGLSGGKDSFALIDLLVNLNHNLPEKYKVEACHVIATDMPYKADLEFMKKYCDSNEIPLHFEQITVDYRVEGRQPACFICSWKRRKVLFKMARQRGCNKLALGHHLNDAVETLLLNMIHHSSISSIPPMLSMFNGELYTIRPLILIHAKELKKYSDHLHFPAELSLCPFDDKTSRDMVRNQIIQMSKLNRSAEENIFRSMSNICSGYLVQKPIKKNPS